MSKHTPGPWTTSVEPESGAWIISGALDSVASTHFCYAEEREANAQLIAAAPDMYEALKVAVMAIEECGFQEHSGEMCVIRAALAKAEGRP